MRVQTGHARRPAARSADPTTTLAHRPHSPLRRHDYLYYVRNEPEISDAKYDRLFEELQELEAEFPQLQTDDSPTRRVGAPPLEEFEKVKHAAAMLSLDSSTDREALKGFVDRVGEAGATAFVLEPKFDGLSVEFVYADGELASAATRGNGRVGEGVLQNVRTIRSVPLRLRDDAREVPKFLSVRGEVVMPVDAFSELNERLLDEGGSVREPTQCCGRLAPTARLVGDRRAPIGVLLLRCAQRRCARRWGTELVGLRWVPPHVIPAGGSRSKLSRGVE